VTFHNRAAVRVGRSLRYPRGFEPLGWALRWRRIATAPTWWALRRAGPIPHGAVRYGLLAAGRKTAKAS
jgi:hypothetical protein